MGQLQPYATRRIIARIADRLRYKEAVAPIAQAPPGAHRCKFRSADAGGNDRHGAISVSSFMNKFRKLGFISYNGRIEVHRSLLNAVLQERPQIDEE